jgi:hypothetical protein
MDSGLAVRSEPARQAKEEADNQEAAGGSKTPKTQQWQGLRGSRFSGSAVALSDFVPGVPTTFPFSIEVSATDESLSAGRAALPILGGRASCNASPTASSRCHRAGSAASIASPSGGWSAGPWGVPSPVVLPVSRIDEAFDEPGTLRDPKRAARVRPFIDELI